jgi:hypothetical protein
MLTFLQKAMMPTGQPMLRASQRGFATVAPHSRMPTQKNYYEVLGIGSDATPE